MQNRNYSSLLYFISLVIVATLGIQVYWNYKNYKAGKQQLINEVQASLDNAIDSYYVNLADRNTMGFSLKGGGDIMDTQEFDSILKKLDLFKQPGEKIDSLKKDFPQVQFHSGSQLKDTSASTAQNFDSLKKDSRLVKFHYSTSYEDTTIGTGKKLGDKNSVFQNIQNDTSININLKSTLQLASQVIVSITTDTLDISELNAHIKDQLRQKNIDPEFGYVFQNNSGDVQEFNTSLEKGPVLSTQSKSAYLPKNSSFRFFFTNDTATILKRNFLGILLSALLIAAVIGCLLFLLKIINRQKQLAELKNDLISNITHEFKTPISTVKVALEGIENFNEENDPVKTRNYLQVSNNQLDKLQMMVEKLLETATLDGDNLQLKKEEVPVVKLLSDLIQKHQNLAPEKKFTFSAEDKEVLILADAFHLENALNNILDNAVKYGGGKIEAVVSAENEVVKMKISDNGSSLTKPQAEQVFDKFYRVPKGNTHDVKGFGIGLFYTKNIIEKHGGSIELKLNNQTNFHITIPKNA